MPFIKGHKGFRNKESYVKAGNKIGLNPNSQKTQFKKGMIPWSKSQKGIHLSPKSEFKKGMTPWNKGKRYKGKPCSEESKIKIGMAQMGEKNHNWQGGKPKCIDCGKILSQWHKTRVRCRRCFGISKRGEKHWNWTGGLSHEPYPYYFRETLKRKIRTRDSFICQYCGKWGNSIHHIDYNKNNCEENNLITVCKPCNTKANFNRDNWIKIFKEKICQILI